MDVRLYSPLSELPAPVSAGVIAALASCCSPVITSYPTLFFFMKHGFTRFGQLPRYAWLALFLMLLNCWLALPSRAQTQAVSGRVTTAKSEGLPGVNVVVKGATTGTVTNGAGQYSLGMPSNQVTVLTFSFVGFQSQDVTSIRLGAGRGFPAEDSAAFGAGALTDVVNLAPEAYEVVDC